MTECSHCRKRYDNGVRFCPVDGYAVVPVAEPLLGRTLMGQFQIQSVCGHGATGTVYRAMQVGMDREVAVKILRADLLKDADVIKRFVREARAGARLNHPNIATVHMVGQTDEGVPFLVMEYVEGVPLAAVLGVGKPLPLRRIVHIGAQIASALAEAHGQGIVHRDLKPENILLSQRRGEADVVKVVDFGIAKMVVHAAPGEDPISRMGTVFGTPHYIAPEQASGQAVDGRADIYSLGCILFQMATGKVPFDGQQGLQVLLRQVRDPVPDPRSLNPRLTPALATLILQMLAKDPAERPQSAALLVTSLKALDEDAGDERSASAATAGKSGAATRASGRPRSGAARDERSRDGGDWFQRDAAEDDAPRAQHPEDEDEPDEADAPEPDLDEDHADRPVPHSRRTGEKATRSGRPASGRPAHSRTASGRAAQSRLREPAEDSQERPLPFWQQHGKQLIGLGIAIALGVTVGLLYAYSRQPAPPAPAPTAPTPPAPASPPMPLLRPSTGGSTRPSVTRPAAAPTPTPSAPASKPGDAKPPTSPAGAAAGSAPAAPGHTAVGTAPAPTAPATPAPAAAPAAGTPAPAPTPPAAAPVASPVVAAPAPPAAPTPPTPAAAPTPPVPETKPETKPDPVAAPPEKPPEKPAEKPTPPAPPSDDNEASSDPYRRLH